MFVIYHRIARIPVLPALAAAGAVVIVGGIAVTILAIVGIVACGTRMLRAFGFVSAEPRLPLEGDDAIEDVVVHRSSAGVLER